MQPSITLRLAEASDAEAIARLAHQTAEAGLSWIFTPGRVRAALRDRDTNVLVAHDGDHVVGAGIMKYGLAEAHLELLAVDPAHRGAGLGRRMLEWLEGPARAGGASVVWLEVRASSEAAQAFYRRLGYRDLAVLPRYYDGREAALRMGRDLITSG
jgi:ribosomal-protein-alanine N-acetyltransferase